MQTETRSGRVWITGAGGLIGNCLAQSTGAGAGRFEIVALTHAALDLTDLPEVERRFRADQPALVLHCGAMTRVPQCQANPVLAKRINIDATAHLAGLAREVAFVFFSTDLVFDGRKGNYTETDAVNPLSVYGETKAQAEQIVLANPRHTVIRTSLNSGRSPKGTAYNELFLAAWKKSETLHLFTDEFRCPIPASVTARAVWELVDGNHTGLFHLAGSERLSRAALGRLSAERHPDIRALIEHCSLREYQGAPRPADTSLDCSRIQKLLSFTLPGLTQYLREHPQEPF